VNADANRCQPLATSVITPVLAGVFAFLLLRRFSALPCRRVSPGAHQGRRNCRQYADTVGPYLADSWSAHALLLITVIPLLGFKPPMPTRVIVSGITMVVSSFNASLPRDSY